MHKEGKKKKNEVSVRRMKNRLMKYKGIFTHYEDTVVPELDNKYRLPERKC